MTCDVCSNEATVFLTQIINGQMTTVNLCEQCSKAKGVTDELGFGLAEAFLGDGALKQAVSSSSSGACPTCGFTASQLKKIGRMGCPDCYTAFREGLEPMLSSMHKGTRHVGKRPTRLMREAHSQASLNELREALQKAIDDERYEEAASLKKEIDTLEKRVAAKAASDNA